MRLACLMIVCVSLVGAAAEQPALRVEVTRVELVEAGLEAVEVDLFVEAQTERATRVRAFRFHGLRANGMPAYIAPVLTPVELPAGSRVALGPFRATFFLRDMSSLAPLRDLFESGRVRLEGTARSEIDLDWIERLALWSRRGVVWHSFDHEVEVRIPGGTLRALSARAFFALAEPVVQAGLELRRARDAWFDEAWEQSIARVAAVRTVYVYRRKGEPDPIRAETLVTGVVVSPSRVLVPLEAIEPWRSDPETAFALRSGEIELVGGGDVELLIPNSDGRGAQSLRASRSEIQVHLGPCETERLLLTDARGKTRQVKVCRSSGESALAALEISTPTGRPPLAAEAEPALNASLELTAMRLIRAPDSGDRAWEMIRLQGERMDGEIRLTEPIDRSLLGSPLFLGGAPVAIVQHERGGVLLPTAD